MVVPDSGSTSEAQSERSTPPRRNAAFFGLSPARLLALGYLSYIVAGWALLSLPAMSTPNVTVSAIDALFIAASAVTTTGLVTIDPGGSFSFAGELVILLLLQVGGLGYMTISSFAVMALQNRLSRFRRQTVKESFHLPNSISLHRFLPSVLIFTVICQSVGAAALYVMFRREGAPDPGWSAIFHAISAFCTAGFSLNANGLEDFRNHVGVNAVISTLSLLGAVGFLIVVDSWRRLTGRPSRLGFTSKVIVRMTFGLLLGGAALLALVEPGIAVLPLPERLMTALFQSMSAATTVGFNTHPVGELAAASLIVLFVLMAIGASPAGTGGGMKTTTLAVLVGVVRSTLKGRDQIRFAKRLIPAEKVQTASATLAYYVGVLMVATLLLCVTEAGARFEVIVFEALSAMGTVGLSMGLTGDLTEVGKLIVVVLMFAGRVGLLTFGVAIASHDESPEDLSDNELVM